MRSQGSISQMHPDKSCDPQAMRNESQLSFDTVIDLPCKLVDLFSLCAATDWMMEERDLQRLLQPVSSGSLTHPYAPSICFHAQSVSSQWVLHLVILAHRWWLEHPLAKCWLFARPLPLTHVRTTRTYKPTWANPAGGYDLLWGLLMQTG